MAAGDQNDEGTRQAAASPPVVADAASTDGANLEAERCFARGIELQRRDELEAAARAYGEALRHQPAHLRAINNLALTLRARGLRVAAAACFRRGLAYEPDDTALLGNLGNTLRELGEYEAAATVQHRAIALAPQSPEAHLNLGLTLRDLGHLAEATLCFEQVLRLKPGHVQASWELTITRLTEGDYTQGFPELEQRWRLRQTRRPHPEIPSWQGEPLAGKRLLLFNEQPYGDGILFARFAQHLRPLGATQVALEIHRPLSRLFWTLPGVDRVLVRGEGEPAADYSASLLSLPGLLGLDRAGVASPPYLKAPAVGRPPLARPPGTRLAVGLCWAGRPTHQNDRQRSTGLKPFLPLLSRPEVLFVSLQKGPAAAEVAQQGVEALLRDLSPEIEDFADLAHWMAQLDLVISVDTAVAHLAGAMGRPCWTLLPFAADWRWGRVAQDTPWYGRMHLFRQAKPGDWSQPFSLVGEALDQVLLG